ncbi:hypothetical protein [Pseudonocardia alni]|uniref:hypothetical protein n=1 Tax=Pseudonocardia alni TaxID=33907 RepID=UPI001AD76F07|nr:hypothetical protein [Pseudonocardia alni]MBO4239799.1 hypothetical protein [Pseudonocardia alni]
MELGELSGWVAAAIAIGAMCVAIWNASSAEKQAQSAFKQAEEAEKSRLAAEGSLNLAQHQNEENSREQKNLKSAELHRLIHGYASFLEATALELQLLANELDSSGVVDDDLKTTRLRLHAELQQRTQSFLLDFFPICHRMPTWERLLGDYKQMQSVISLHDERDLDRFYDVEAIETVSACLERTAGRFKDITMKWTYRARW